MLRIASIFCFIAMCGLLSWFGVSVSLETIHETKSVLTEQEEDARHGTGLVVEEPEKDLGVVGGGTHVLSFKVANPTGKPWRLLGIGGEKCNAAYCLKLLGEFPAAPVGPGDAIEVRMGLQLSTPGPFDVRATFYLEGDATCECVLRIRGMVLQN